MAVTQLLNEFTFQEFRGKSTDEKPTINVENGSVFIELDTAKGFMFDADSGEWKEI